MANSRSSSSFLLVLLFGLEPSVLDRWWAFPAPPRPVDVTAELLLLFSPGEEGALLVDEAPAPPPPAFGGAFLEKHPSHTRTSCPIPNQGSGIRLVLHCAQKTFPQFLQ